MKKPIVCGIILGMLASSAVTFAQSNPVEKTQKGHSSKKSSVKKMSVKKVSGFPTAVSGVSKKQIFNPKSLYAQNTVGTGGAATDTGSAATAPQATKVMINPPLTAPSGTTSTPLAATVAKKKSAFSFKYRSYNAENLNALEMPAAAQKDHEVQAWDRINFSYNFTDNVSVSLMPQIFHTWFGDRDRSQGPGLDQPFAFYMGDTALYLIDSKLAQFGGFTLDGSQAYLFSTSEASLKNGTIGQTRSGLGLGRSIGPIDIKWSEQLWYYMQQYQTSSLFTTNGLPIQNLNYQLWSLLDIGWNVTKKLSINLESGFMNQATNPDDNASSQRAPVLADYIILDPEIDYSFNEHFSIGLGIWEQYDMRAQPAVVTDPNNGNTPVTWLPQYYPFDYRNGSQAYIQTTVKF